MSSNGVYKPPRLWTVTPEEAKQLESMGYVKGGDYVVVPLAEKTRVMWDQEKQRFVPFETSNYFERVD